MPPAECQSCGRKLPAKSRFCPECGSPVNVSTGETAVQQVPQFVGKRRFFGVPPSTLLFGIGFAALVLAAALVASGSWPWGLIVLGLAMFVFTGAVSQTRRLPGEASSATRASLAAVRSLRARAGAAVEAVAARGNAKIELVGLRRSTGELAAERHERMRELGEAVYAGNQAATKDLKQRIKQIDDDIEAKEAEMANVTMEAKERIGRAQLPVQPTQILPRDEELPDPVPEPATVPEPFPPPDEGQPPEPARIPEPFPPPDEGDRPRQPTIPEPGPNTGPE